jgi:Putative peptidoglycan binding domain
VVVAVLSVASVALLLDASPVAADLPELQACVAHPELIRGDSGPDVHCLQFTLAMLGYPVVDSGVYDRATEDAVRWFQATRPGLISDGRAGERTLRALQIDTGSVHDVFVPVVSTAPLCLADAQIDPTERGQSVTCLQRKLAELGYYTGSITGLHDKASIDALRAYQKATPPLKVDGKGGAQTLAALGIWSGITTGSGRNTGPGPFPAPIQDEPFWNLTAEGIPFYGNHVACTASEAAVIAAEFGNDGADSATQQWAVYIASREGGCRFDNVNVNPRTRDDSHCTFQLNALAHMFEPNGSLGRRGWTTDSVKMSLQACADAASDLWVYCGRGPWLPPYSCMPPWAGAAIGQPPPLLPTSSSLPEPGEPEPPVPTVPTTTAPDPPVTTTTSTPPTTTTSTTTTIAG